MDILMEYTLSHCCASVFMWRVIFNNQSLMNTLVPSSSILQSQHKYLTIQKDFSIFLPVVTPLTSTFLASRSTVRYPHSLWAQCLASQIASLTSVYILVMSGNSYQTAIYQPSEILAVPTQWLAWQKYNCSYSLYGHKPNRSRIKWRKTWEGLG